MRHTSRRRGSVEHESRHLPLCGVSKKKNSLSVLHTPDARHTRASLALPPFATPLPRRSLARGEAPLGDAASGVVDSVLPLPPRSTVDLAKGEGEGGGVHGENGSQAALEKGGGATRVEVLRAEGVAYPHLPPARRDSGGGGGRRVGREDAIRRVTLFPRTHRKMPPLTAHGIVSGKRVTP